MSSPLQYRCETRKIEADHMAVCEDSYMVLVCFIGIIKIKNPCRLISTGIIFMLAWLV